jgi:outer membrane immunogenic protein
MLVMRRPNVLALQKNGLGRIHGGNHMRKLLVAGIAAAAFCGAPALAADMPVKAPAIVPVFNWTGFYVGGVVGYGWATSTHCAVAAGCLAGFPVADPKGWNGGVTLGYNLQTAAHWVLGVEGDWSWANMKGHSPDTAAFGCALSCDTKIKSFETLRGRFGYAFDRFLPYLTAGVAFTQLNASIGAPVLGGGSTTKSSFTAGGGLEYTFSQNLSAKVEYLYIAKLGDFIYAPTLCGSSCFVRTRADNEIRVGLNYKFGDPWGKAPVVAKY